MTLSVDIFVNPKYKGEMYHLLEEKEQSIVDEQYPDGPETIYESNGDWDIYQFLKENSDSILTEEDITLMYIDIDKIGNVIYELQEKIKGITGKMDIYDHENYGDDSDVYVWTKLLGVIKNYFKHNDMTKNYLVIKATW